jgi:5'-nucleotidase
MKRAPSLLASAFAIALGTLALIGCQAADPPPWELTILHTNDTHSRLLEIDRFGASCRDEDRDRGECIGGVARRATLVEEIRSTTPNVLLLDGGDQFQGTLFYNRFKGEAAAQVMTWLSYDAMVLGNHEFDDGPEVLGRFLQRIDFPVLATNLGVEDEPALDGELERLAVVETGGRRVGLVGALIEETATLSRPGPTVDFLPIEETVTEAVEELLEAGVDIIVLLSHSGYARDLKLAAAIPGLDIIVGGHTNTLLDNDDERARGPYPTVVEGPDSTPVLVVTAFAYGAYLGRLDVTFDDDGTPIAWDGEPLLLDASIEPDPEILARLAPLEDEVDRFSGREIGVAAVDLIGSERVCRVAECNLGNLIADALLAAHPDAEVALQNAGGIRTSLGAGPISFGRLLEVLPFGNTASTFDLRGDDLLAALEHGVSQAEDLSNDGTGRFLQVAGLRYEWAAEAPPGSRILKVEIRGENGDWQPLDPERRYHVVTNDFTRNGGDGFEVLATEAIDPYDQGRVVSDVVADWIATHSPVAPEVEGRIVRRDG